MSKQNCVKWDKKAKDDKCTCTYISVPPPHLMLKCPNLVRQLSLISNGTFFLQCKYNPSVTKKIFILHVWFVSSPDPQDQARWCVLFAIFHKLQSCTFSIWFGIKSTLFKQLNNLTGI